MPEVRDSEQPSAWRTVNTGSNRKLLLRGLEAVVACVPARGREDGYSVVVEAQEGPLGNSLLAVEIETRPNGPEVERVGPERRFERVDRLTQPSACIHHLDRVPVVRAPDSYLIGDSTGVGEMPSDVDLQVLRPGEGLPAKRRPEGIHLLRACIAGPAHHAQRQRAKPRRGLRFGAAAHRGLEGQPEQPRDPSSRRGPHLADRTAPGK